MVLETLIHSQMRVKDLEIGEWYTSPSSLNDNILGIKVMSTYKTSLTYQEVINKKLGYYKRSDIGAKDLPEAVFIQTPVEDLKNYLPKDHPDYLALSTDPIFEEFPTRGYCMYDDIIYKYLENCGYRMVTPTSNSGTPKRYLGWNEKRIMAAQNSPYGSYDSYPVNQLKQIINLSLKIKSNGDKKSNINEVQRSTTKVSRSDRSGTVRVANRRCTRAAGSRPQGNVTQVKVRKTRVIMSKIRGSIRFSSDFC